MQAEKALGAPILLVFASSNIRLLIEELRARQPLGDSAHASPFAVTVLESFSEKTRRFPSITC